MLARSLFVGFRNVLIHAYDQVVPEEVLNATDSLPPLLERVRGIRSTRSAFEDPRPGNVFRAFPNGRAVFMEVYEVIRFVHILAAMFLIGMIPLEFLLVRRVLASGDHPRMAKTFLDLEWVENRVAIPTVAFLLGSGLAMTVGPYAQWALFSDPWFPTVGLGLLAVVLPLFAGVVPSRYKVIRKWAEAGGQGTMPAQDWKAWFGLAAVLAFAAVYVMVLRPF